MWRRRGSDRLTDEAAYLPRREEGKGEVVVCVSGRRLSKQMPELRNLSVVGNMIPSTYSGPQHLAS